MAVATNDPVEALDIIDTMNNTMCLLLDPCEATRCTHPDAANRNAAIEAFDMAFHHMTELNANRDLYDALVACLEPEQWARLTPIQQRNAKVMKDDMDSHGIHMDRDKRDYIVRLTAEKEKYAHLLVRASPGEQQQVLDALIQTRHKLAVCLGSESFSHWSLPTTMAKSPQSVWSFINSISNRLQSKAQQEAGLLTQVKGHYLNTQNPPKLQDYEVDHLSGLYLNDRYGDSMTKLREYLSVANVWRGVQLICDRLFDVTVERQQDMAPHERYHPTVQKYVLYRNGADGKKGEMIGTIYADLMHRADKVRGAGHYTVQLGTTVHAGVLDAVDVNVPVTNGSYAKQLPIVIFSCNAPCDGVVFGAASGDDFWEQVLLSPDETATLFHEFGHALHSVFGQTEVQNLAGTRSSLDYVETFSQFMEYYAKDYRVLREYAFHHKTREPVPLDLVAHMNTTDSLFGATKKLNELILSASDLVFHGPRPLSYIDAQGASVQFTGTGTVLPQLKALHTPTIGFSESSTDRAVSLVHIANYPSAYYSYAYSRVIAASIWNKYFKDDPFSKEGGAKLKYVMSLGASQHPEEMLGHLFEGETDPCVLMQELDVHSLDH
eukprot:TRINITY_DN35535_c0_g1_i1.p1 TRINITY_DN35535_c0_g1~~TRINITY_DN35535_c0_g1_i1.p1  ORF type:complete len:680 (+),score=275.61 TRINITY_DN35535_c0_g1_i1:223-2040(+)